MLAEGLGGDPETDRLRNALAVAQADLRLHVAALSKLQGELSASRVEAASTRQETINFRGYLQQSQADVEAAHVHIGELSVRAAAREAEFAAAIAALHAEAAALQTALALVHASFSWRVTRPVRVMGRILRWCRRAMRPGAHSTTPAQPGAAASAAAAAPPIIPDPNAPYLFKSAPFGDVGQGTVTVEELHHLSRLP